MQTYLVHMRSPLQLLREIGVRQFVGFQLFMISTILSPLVHPWFYVMMAADAWSGTLLVEPIGLWSTLLWWLALANLVAGYASSMLIGALAVRRRRRPRLIVSLAMLPFYWLAISLAAYRAVRELVVAPHHWQKTPHAARPLAGKQSGQRHPRG